MHRCLQLAKLAIGDVASNPMVGSVLVHGERIIGEGYHREYGKEHAEVNCLASVKEEDQPLIPESTLYVSLEPCAHFGKTPPCADLIIEKKIPKVVVGCRDPFIQVNGKGIEKLRAAGINLEVGILEEECKALNKRFFTFHTLHRPYIALKWAQTLDHKIAYNTSQRLKITNEFTNRIVHRWRSEEMGIVVGTNTAINDNPQLDVRLWPGKNPLRVVVDMDLRLPQWLHLFDEKVPTLVFNKQKHSLPFEKTTASSLTGVQYYQVTDDVNLIHQLLNGLYSLGIQSILVEGGAQLLQSFIEAGLWDEAKVITNEQLIVGEGLNAPPLISARLIASETIFSDVLRYYQRVEN